MSKAKKTIQLPSRAVKLARRYPQLKQVPEAERAAIVRAALLHPLVLLFLVGGGLLVLPHYLQWMFAFFHVDAAPDDLFKWAKICCIVLAPIIVLVPLMTKFFIPRFIQNEMRKRGFSTKGQKKL